MQANVIEATICVMVKPPRLLVMVMMVASVVVAACGSGSSDSQTSRTTTTFSDTRLGCKRHALAGAPKGVSMVDPYCSEVRVIGLLCGMHDEDIAVPPDDEVVNPLPESAPQEVIRQETFQTKYGPARLISTIGSKHDGVHFVCTGPGPKTVIKDYTLDEWKKLTGVGSEASAATTTTAPPLAFNGIVLRPRGLSDNKFGDSASDVVASLTKKIGAPDSDETFEAAQCYPAVETRRVRWHELGVYFAEGRLSGWSTTHGDSPQPASTSKGIHSGSKLAAAENAYSSDYHETDRDTYNIYFALGDPGPDAAPTGIRGWANRKTTVIDQLWSGDTCDPGEGD